jgi:hypothetical protein
MAADDDGNLQLQQADWPPRQELAKRLRAAIGCRRPDGTNITYAQVAKLWDTNQTDAETKLGLRNERATRRATVREIRLLAAEVDLPVEFFYADFRRLHEIVPRDVIELERARQAELAAKKLQREIVERLLADSDQDRADYADIEQPLDREDARGDVPKRASRDTKSGQRRRRREAG